MPNDPPHTPRDGAPSEATPPPEVTPPHAPPPPEVTPSPEAAPPSELAERTGTRPDMTQPRPLRVPTSPQREHILGEAEALRRYIEDGGPIDYFRSNRPGDHKRLAFVVDRDRYNRIRAQLRAEQTGNHPWIWQPKRGLHRSST